MYERFGEQARKLMTRGASEIAGKCYDGNIVGTQHMLVSLFYAGDSPAPRALRAKGLKADACIQRLQQEAEWTDVVEHSKNRGRAREVEERASAIAEKLGKGKVEPEHILLAILEIEGCVAHKLLNAFGVTPKSLYEEVCKQMGLSGSVPAPV